MRQDTDVARMAAALRTPSLKYRSFGNEAVRNPPPPPAATEEQAFSILGDALAGANEISPDTVLGQPAPLPTEAPMLPVGDAYATHQVPAPQPYPVAPNPHVELQRAPLEAPPLPEPVVTPAPLPVAPPASVEVPVAASLPSAPLRAAPLAPEPQGQSLLQVLLGGQAPASVPVAPQAAPTQAAPVPPPAPMGPPAAAPVAQPVVPAADRRETILIFRQS